MAVYHRPKVWMKTKSKKEVRVHDYGKFTDVGSADSLVADEEQKFILFAQSCFFFCSF